MIVGLFVGFLPLQTSPKDPHYNLAIIYATCDVSSPPTKRARDILGIFLRAFQP